ncbi:hypothetical protein [Shimia sp. R9_2]|nr:hypothetical protein [Shimia sp. R9_2]
MNKAASAQSRACRAAPRNRTHALVIATNPLLAHTGRKYGQAK